MRTLRARPKNGAKMGQTVRQSMPFNAKNAFVQLAENSCRRQQPQASPLESFTYSYTIGVWEDRSEVFLLIG